MFAIYTCEEFNIPRSRGPLLSESNPSQKKKKFARPQYYYPTFKKILLPQQNVCVCAKPITKFHFRGETKRHNCRSPAIISRIGHVTFTVCTRLENTAFRG